jgi:hypothetical protein
MRCFGRGARERWNDCAGSACLGGALGGIREGMLLDLVACLGARMLLGVAWSRAEANTGHTPGERESI